MFNLKINRFGTTPPVVKNIIYINIVMYVASWVLRTYNIDVVRYLGLHYFGSSLFSPVQLISHMFLHSMVDIWHIFFNMFGLWMFGRILENVWGSKRFFIYFIVTGIGAALVHTFVNYLQYSHIQHLIDSFSNTPSLGLYQSIVRDKIVPHGIISSAEINFFDNYPFDPYVAKERLSRMLVALENVPTIGASGAVYGVLLAFGMLFPNTELMLLFPPIPIKAKWFVLIYGGIELYSGLSQPGSNIAHFAHLGGMLFGFILIKIWSRQRSNFY